MADELIAAVKKGLSSRLACSLPLPDYSAGEVDIIYALFGVVHVLENFVHLRCALEEVAFKALEDLDGVDTSDPNLIFVTDHLYSSTSYLLSQGGGADIQPKAGNLIISIPLQVTSSQRFVQQLV